MDEKADLEKAAVEKFVAAYNQLEQKAPLKLKQMGDAPDAVLYHGDGEIGIEVAHIYGTDFDARNALGRAGDIHTIQSNRGLWKEHVENATIPLHLRFIPSLNRIIAEKAQMRFDGPCWLVIRNATMLWAKSDFEEHRSSLRLPTAHCFEQIWLLCGVDASSGLLRLDES